MAWRDEQRELARLRHLPAGEYRVPFSVPYIPQFASPDLIHQYIHAQFDGESDPLWHTFGAPDPKDYAFWSPRVCALAAIKMAIAAHQLSPSPTLWELVQQGLALDGYRHYDEQGRHVDEGWYFHAQQKLAEKYGLKVTGYSYVAPAGICRHIHEGKLVMATVTPELGEREALSKRYGGHVVLVHGFRWQQGAPTHFILHNPSGRYPELQADAVITAQRFRQSFAFRYATITVDR